ncbi:NAD-dependent epimerase/dehydratase family protein [Streptosporangium minutum]|uniref:NAD-dependent epimerase/dehydratase domain-containing protein n=1 Tax=Streptosporangium minutum TaxID=569862 RepID=A0A243RUF1_9ACTN|nr:hypothetical protein [Streptosporangium minutum]OUC98764.1 hypothetical protein CA984_05815 [Streptosporangium minutum]
MQPVPADITNAEELPTALDGRQADAVIHQATAITGVPFLHRHLYANEDQVLGTSGIDGIALRYGMFYGPEPATRRLIDLARRRRLLSPRPSGTVSLIHIHGAASTTVAALYRGRPGQPYNIVDDQPVTFEDYFHAIAQAAGVPVPRPVPSRLLTALPHLRALMVTTHIRLSNRRAVDELGRTPRYHCCRDGLAALVAKQPGSSSLPDPA